MSGRLPNGAISLVMSDLHSQFPLHVSYIQEIQLQAAGLSIFVPLLMHPCISKDKCVSIQMCPPQETLFELFYLGLESPCLDPHVESNGCRSMEAENHWKKKNHLPWPSYRRRKLYTHAVILTHDLKTQVALNIVHSEQEIQDEGHRERHNTFIQ